MNSVGTAVPSLSVECNVLKDDVLKGKKLSKGEKLPDAVAADCWVDVRPGETTVSDVLKQIAGNRQIGCMLRRNGEPPYAVTCLRGVFLNARTKKPIFKTYSQPHYQFGEVELDRLRQFVAIASKQPITLSFTDVRNGCGTDGTCYQVEIVPDKTTVKDLRRRLKTATGIRCSEMVIILNRSREEFDKLDGVLTPEDCKVLAQGAYVTKVATRLVLVHMKKKADCAYLVRCVYGETTVRDVKREIGKHIGVPPDEFELQAWRMGCGGRHTDYPLADYVFTKEDLENLHHFGTTDKPDGIAGQSRQEDDSEDSWSVLSSDDETNCNFRMYGDDDDNRDLKASIEKSQSWTLKREEQSYSTESEGSVYSMYSTESEGSV